MGAWGAGSFDNDDAMDFVGELEGAGVEPVNAALDAVLNAEGLIEAPTASVALAAAEAVATLRNQPPPGVPPEVLEWAKIGLRIRLTQAFFENAKRAVERVRDRSELKDLWAQSEDNAAWQAKVEDLLARLS